MPMTPLHLERARPGGAVTAQAWNDLIGGVDKFYEAFGSLGREYVRVNVTYREGPVPGARVVAVPVDAGGHPSGPPIEGAPAGGDGTEFRLPAVSAATWTIYSQAPGFALVQTTLDVPQLAAATPIKTVDVELAATHVSAPDIVGMSVFVAGKRLAWGGFAHGVDTEAEQRDAGLDSYGTIVLQSPPAGTPRPVDRARPGEPVAVVNTLHRAATSPPPWRTVVLGYVGWPEDYMLSLLEKSFAQTPGERTVLPGANDHLRVVAQHPPAGAVVPAGTPLSYTVASGDRATVTMRRFAGTHPALADRTAMSLFEAIAEPVLPLASTDWWRFAMPWTAARTSISDAAITTMRERFAAANAPVTAASGGLATAWETLRIAAAVASAVTVLIA